MKKRIWFALALLCHSGAMIFSQDIQIKYNGSANYTLRERTDLRRYDNGKYTGLTSREVTSFITPVFSSDGYKYEGNFFVNQDTRRASLEIGNSIRCSIPSEFKIDREGKLTMITDNGYPSFRSFPTFTTQKIKPGDTWQAKAERAVDPLNKGIVTKMPIYVQYTYKADEVFNGEPVYLLTAQWATRYGSGSGTTYIDWGGDKELVKATGSHNATIYVSKLTGNAIVVRDTVDETFLFADGNQVAFKGTISLFTEYPPAFDRSKLIPALQRIAGLTDEQADELLKPVNPSSQIAMADFSTENSSSAGKNTSTTNANHNSENYDFNEPVNSSSWVGKNNARPKTDKSQSAKSQTDKSQTNKTAANALANASNSKNTNTLANANNSKKSDSVTKNQNTQKISEKSEGSGIKVDSTPAGIRLTINLKFKADSAELLPEEEKRLSDIAEILKEAEGAQFLVEGHTASTGNLKGEKQLSEDRANAIAQKLSSKGISSGRFITKGSGGTKPVADNSTAEGKAANRRVEITIL